MPPFDLAPYLRRIGWIGPPPRADLASLQRLVALHTAAIPFENLTPWSGEPVRLEPEALVDKLVHRRRGGYCYEHNGLFLAVLTSLGLPVERLAARVVWGLPTLQPTPRTHRLLRVLLDGEPWLVDVGFGGLTMTGAIRLAPDLMQPTPHERLRLQHHPDDPQGDWHLQAEVAGTWRPLYRFTLQPQDALDDTLGNHFTATHPASRFVLHLVAARVQPDRRTTLLDRELRVHRIGQPSTLRTLRDEHDARHVLMEDFGLALPDSAAFQARLTALFNPTAPI